MNVTVDTLAPDWLEKTLVLLEDSGLALLPGVLSSDDLEQTRVACAHVDSRLRTTLGASLEQARRSGEADLRLPMKFDPHFYRFLENRQLLALVDALLTPSATLRFQNVGVIQAGRNPFRPGPWHMNFRPGVRGYRAALEIGFAVDRIDEGMYHFALGSHQRPRRPDDQSLQTLARTFAIEAGTMIVFDSTLWHREGEAEPEEERRLVNHQFVRHFIKPHIDHVRALGEPAIQALPERTRRLLGWESRVPASLEEFYVRASDRVYLPDQG